MSLSDEDGGKEGVYFHNEFGVEFLDAVRKLLKP